MKLSQGIAYGLAAALVGLSARAAFAPRAAAQAYGVPVPGETDPTPFLEVKANRDLTLAGLLAVSGAAGGSTLAAALLVGSIAPLADAWTVVRHGAPAGTAVHLATAATLIGGSALAATGR